MSKIIDAQRVIVDACHLFNVIGFAMAGDGGASQPLCAAVNGVAKIGEDKLIEAMKLLDHAETEAPAAPGAKPASLAARTKRGGK